MGEPALKIRKVPIKQVNISKSIQYVLLPVVIIALWQLAFNAGFINPVALPSPRKVAATFLQLLGDGQLVKHTGISILRVLEGYTLAAVSGIVLGVAVGLSPFLNRITDLLIQTIKPIPPIAWIPLAILWFGIGETSKVFLIFLGAFFPIIINVIDGIRQTEQKLIEVSKVLEAPWRRFILKLVIPGALPSIVTGLRVGIGSAWMCVVAAELIAAEQGIGYLIMDGRQLAQPDLVIVGMVTIGLVGKLMDVLLKKVEARLIRWKVAYSGG